MKHCRNSATVMSMSTVLALVFASAVLPGLCVGEDLLISRGSVARKLWAAEKSIAPRTVDPLPAIVPQQVFVQLSEGGSSSRSKPRASGGVNVGTHVQVFSKAGYKGYYTDFTAPVPGKECGLLSKHTTNSANSIKIKWNVADGRANHVLCGKVILWQSSACTGRSIAWVIPGGLAAASNKKFNYPDTNVPAIGNGLYSSISCAPTSNNSAADPCQSVTCPPFSQCQKSSSGKAVCYCFPGFSVVNNQCVPPSPTDPPPPRAPSSSSPPPPRTTTPLPPPPSGSSGGHADYLVPHNAARAAVGVDPLQWSDSVAASAQAWADVLYGMGCAMQHGGHEGLGQNLAWASGMELTPQISTKMWVDEGSLYSYAVFPDGCNSPSGWAACGHYTQIIWKNTKFLGCGSRVCSSSGSTIVVCDYQPPGNYIGQYPY